MMRFSGRHVLHLLAPAALAVALQAQPALAQTAAPAASLIDQLVGSETEIDLDLAAIRQKAADRIQARADVQPLRRPQLAPQLDKYPHFDFDVVFDPDSALIRPQSYQVIGRIADAMSDPKLLPYAFLVINHTESTGSRKDNLALSQKRADSIRAVLAGTFKISAKRLFAIGLGEEQLRDATKPSSPANARAQIATIGKRPDDAPKPAADSAPAKKGSAAKKKRAN